jgi:hypothetical protein
MADRVVTVKGSNVRIGDFLITDAWASSRGYAAGFVVESIIDLGTGPFGAIREAYGPDGYRKIIHADDRVKVERTY